MTNQDSMHTSIPRTAKNGIISANRRDWTPNHLPHLAVSPGSDFLLRQNQIQVPTPQGSANRQIQASSYLLWHSQFVSQLWPSISWLLPIA